MVVIKCKCNTNRIVENRDLFLWDNYTLFRHNYIIEFDKNANSIYVIVVTPISRKVSLATIGVCVFCAVASLDVP